MPLPARTQLMLFCLQPCFSSFLDYDTLVCPEFKNPVTANEVIPNLECSISKAGTLNHDWLVHKIEQMGLDFTIVDSYGVSFWAAVKVSGQAS